MIPSFASLHEDVNIISSLCEIYKSDYVRMVDFLTDLYLWFYSLYNVYTEFLLLINVLSILDLCWYRMNYFFVDFLFGQNFACILYLRILLLVSQIHATVRAASQRFGIVHKILLIDESGGFLFISGLRTALLAFQLHINLIN